MRKVVPPLLEQARVRGEGSKPGQFDGAYLFELRPPGYALLLNPKVTLLRIIANAACEESAGWEHVSVSIADRTPTWVEMCAVKNLFWDDDEVVVQFHPRKKDYVNCHPFTLHLWRHATLQFPSPPPELVGPNQETINP